MSGKRLNAPGLPIQAPELSGSEPWLSHSWSGESWDEVNINHGKATIILALREMEYSDYLQTEHWRAVRREVWGRQKGKCDICPEQIAEVHHHHYHRRGFERPGDVVGLCALHHDMQHTLIARQMRENFNSLEQ